MGNKVSISNLHPQVTEADVKEIFQKIGKVKSAVVHYDAQGRSRGTAVVHFSNKASTMKAVKEYHQAEVDGRPMYVQAVAVVSAVSNGTPKKSTKKKGPTKKKGKGGKNQNN